jgi:peptide/nickel transport system substrate-binding protein
MTDQKESAMAHTGISGPSDEPGGGLRRRALLKWVGAGLGLVGVGLLGACAPAAPAAAPTQSAAAPAPSQPAAAPTTPAATAAPPAAAPKPTAPPAGPTAAPAAQQATAAPKPASGKNLTLGEWQNVAILNTLMTSETGNVLSGTKLALRGLLFTDENGGFEGELATDVPSLQNNGISADGKTITYHLRPMTWHDGQAVTAADVQYTWKAIMQPDHNVATRYGYDRIDSVDIPDAQTVVVHFKEPFAPWPILFDVVLPQHILEQQADFNNSPYHQQPVGFGPFKVTENIKGDHTTYEAFEAYRRGRPKIDRLFVRYFGNTDSMLQGLKAKEIDLAWQVPLSNIPDLQGQEAQGFTTLVVPGQGAERYAFNMDHQQVPLFAEKDLRRALSMAVDRKTIVDKLLFGLTLVARGEWDNTPWENTDIKSVEYSPEQAKQILDGLGWTPGPDGIRTKNGQRLAFDHATTSGSQLRENVQLLAQQNFADIGVAMTIKNQPTDQLFGSYSGGGVWARGGYQMGGWSQAINLPDPDISARYLTREIASDQNPAGAQWYHYSNPQVDALLGQQATELDASKRKQLFAQVQQLVYDDYAQIWLYNTTSSWGLQTRVKNFDRTVKAPFGGFHWRAEEWDVA